MREPTLIGKHTAYRFDVESAAISIQIRQARLSSDGKLSAFLKYTDTATGNRIPGSGIVNLAAPRSRAGLAKGLELAHTLGENAWEKILDSLYLQLQQRLIEGEPAKVLYPEDPATLKITWLAEPIIPLRMPSVIFGLGGVGKGWLALLIAKAVISGEVPRGLPIEVHHTGPILYLDWETCEQDLNIRWSLLNNGRRDGIIYRRCAGSLAAELDYLQGVVLESKPVLVIVDSAGPACAGDLNSAEVAIEYFRALRYLDVTSLTVAHTPKNHPGTIIGSAYFMNLARSAWEVRSSSEEGSDEMILGVAHRKNNVGPKQRPFGISITIGEREVHTSSADLRTTDMADMNSLSSRIYELISHDGAKLPKEISETIGAPRDQIRARLRDLLGRGLLAQFPDGRYCLPAKEEEPWQAWGEGTSQEKGGSLL